MVSCVLRVFLPVWSHISWVKFVADRHPFSQFLSPWLFWFLFCSYHCDTKFLDEQFKREKKDFNLWLPRFTSWLWGIRKQTEPRQVSILGKENLGTLIRLNYFLLSYWDKGLVGFSCQNKPFSEIFKLLIKKGNLWEDPVVRTDQFPFIWLDFPSPKNQSKSVSFEERRTHTIPKHMEVLSLLGNFRYHLVLPPTRKWYLFVCFPPTLCVLYVCVCLYMHAPVFNKIWQSKETFLFLPFLSSGQ